MKNLWLDYLQGRKILGVVPAPKKDSKVMFRVNESEGGREISRKHYIV